MFYALCNSLDFHILKQKHIISWFESDIAFRFWYNIYIFKRVKNVEIKIKEKKYFIHKFTSHWFLTKFTTAGVYPKKASHFNLYFQSDKRLQWTLAAVWVSRKHKQLATQHQSPPVSSHPAASTTSPVVTTPVRYHTRYSTYWYKAN